MKGKKGNYKQRLEERGLDHAPQMPFFILNTTTGQWRKVRGMPSGFRETK